MAAITFEEVDLQASVPDFKAGWTTASLRWRRDPLTGRSARILTGVKLQPATRPDLSELRAKPAFCPFCAEHLDTATFPFPAELSDEGRIRRGRAVVVPNILAYATHSAVGIYDPEHHFLDLDELSPSVVGDALTAMVHHARAVRRVDPSAALELHQRQLPSAVGQLVDPSPHPVRPRRLRPDRTAQPGRTVGRLARSRVLLADPHRAGGGRTAMGRVHRPYRLADTVRADRLSRSMGGCRRRGGRDRSDRRGHRRRWATAWRGCSTPTGIGT